MDTTQDRSVEASPSGNPPAPAQIMVAICTYERPGGLLSALRALNHQDFGDRSDGDISVVIIDNAAASTAKPTVDLCKPASRFQLYYRNETRKGLAFARNAALSAAKDLGATHLAFIDDDEMPEPGWLRALFSRLCESAAAAAIGPVNPVFAEAPGNSVPREAYAIRTRVDAGFSRDGYTCNVLIDMKVVVDMSLEFDERFNELGGEDTLFFKALTDAGHRIAWAPQAVVHELVPKQRMQARWLWRRWYRTGAVEAQLCRYSPSSAAGRAQNFAKGSVRLVGGTGRVLASALVTGWREPSRTVASFYTLCRGAGLIASVFGREYKEYARANYR